MRRLFFALLGFVFLVAAAGMLWFSFGPQSTEARTTGGVLYTQQEVALTGENLGAVTDVALGSGPVEVPVQVDFAEAASVDLATADQAEVQAAPETIQPQLAMAVPLTTDIVLDEDTGIEVAPIASEAGIAPDGQGGAGTSTVGYEQRVVEMEWPRTFQVGRSGAVRIKLKMLEGGALQPVAEVETNEVVATPILINDRYDTHDAYVTATLSAPDFDIETVSPAQQAMARGDEVEWRWTLKSDKSQKAVIALGLTITWVPKPGQPAGPTDVPIWGQSLEVDVNYVFGMLTVPNASIAGTVLAVLGFVAEMPLLEKFLEIFLDILFDRDRRKNNRRKDNRRRR